MKLKFILLGSCVAVLSAAAGWWAAQHWPDFHLGNSSAAQSDRKVLFYQSSMHPWIKSDKPGRCTICGMELTPIYEGEQGFDAPEGVTLLGSNVIQVLHVQSEPAAVRPLQRVLRVAGTIQDDDTRHRFLSAYMDGRIDHLFVNYVGAEVQKNQPLATFYSPMLLTAEREYLSLLRQPSGADAAVLGEVNRQMQQAARLRLVQYGLTDEQITALAGKAVTNLHTEILAPLTGTVVSRFVYEGQYVKEGERLFEIADFSTMWFQFDAYERDLPWIQLGQEVDVTTPAAAGKSFTGQVVFIDPNLNDRTRSAKVRVELANPVVEENGRAHRELYHRLYAEGRVKVSIPQVLSIPRSAVLNPGGEPVVYLDKGNGAYEQRHLKLGRAGEEYVEVLEGLEAGEPVVTQGNMLIDAQAQLNAGVHGPTHSHDHGAALDSSHGQETGVSPGEPSETLPPFTEPQRQAVQNGLTLAVSLGAALAADDLAAFNERISQTHEVMAALTGAFPADNPWRPALEAVADTSHLTQAPDLKAARKLFHPFSQAAVELTQKARAVDSSLATLKVFRCPMTKDAFPEAPRTASWIQTGLPVRNPWFGAEMIDCGSEVKD